jgi:anthraniloyl-CoA monooxygenase
MRFPTSVLKAVRKVWPVSKPISISFSVTDWAPGGLGLAEAIEIAREFGTLDCDLVHVVTGQTVFRASPPYGRAWETPLADVLRNEAGIRVMVDGNITTNDEVNTILAAGRADLCILAGTPSSIRPA